MRMRTRDEIHHHHRCAWSYGLLLQNYNLGQYSSNSNTRPFLTVSFSFLGLPHLFWYMRNRNSLYFHPRHNDAWTLAFVSSTLNLPRLLCICSLNSTSFLHAFYSHSPLISAGSASGTQPPITCQGEPDPTKYSGIYFGRYWVGSLYFWAYFRLWILSLSN